MISFDDILRYERWQYSNTCFHHLFDSDPLVVRLAQFGKDKRCAEILQEFFDYGVIPSQTVISKQKRKLEAFFESVYKYYYFCKRSGQKPKKRCFSLQLWCVCNKYPYLDDYVEYLRKIVNKRLTLKCGKDIRL